MGAAAAGPLGPDPNRLSLGPADDAVVAEGLRPPPVPVLLPLPNSFRPLPLPLPLAAFCGAASAANFSRMPLLTLPPLRAPLVPSNDSSREVDPVRAADSALSSCVL